MKRKFVPTSSRVLSLMVAILAFPMSSFSAQVKPGEYSCGPQLILLLEQKTPVLFEILITSPIDASYDLEVRLQNKDDGSGPIFQTYESGIEAEKVGTFFQLPDSNSVRLEIGLTDTYNCTFTRK